MKVARLVAVLAISPAAAVAQRVEVNPFLAYQFGGSLRAVEGDLIISSGETYGAAVDIEVRPGGFAQLFYSYQPTSLGIRRSGTGFTNEITDLNIHYFHIGGVGEAEASPRVKGFLAASVGATLFHPSEPRLNDAWRFSVRFGLGGKLFLSQRIGLKAEMDLLVPIQWTTGGFVCGGGGCSGTISGRTTLVHGSLGGGLVVVF